MKELTRDVFAPRDGAVIDITSLRVLADASSEMLQGILSARWPDTHGLILEGLELKGTAAPGGPPGAVRPDANSPEAIITPGRAIVSDRHGTRHLVHLRHEMHVPWPDNSGPRVRGVLAMHTAASTGATDSGIAVARELLTVQMGFVKPNLSGQPNILPISAATGNGQDWANDLNRILQPEHVTIRTLLKRFERLEQSVWKAEPEGAVWDRQILGRSWVRYQTVAASAIQAARMQLAVRGTTTLERVRLMSQLRFQLERSVERTATELLQLVGPADGAGPYRAVAATRGGGN